MEQRAGRVRTLNGLSVMFLLGMGLLCRDVHGAGNKEAHGAHVHSYSYMSASPVSVFRSLFLSPAPLFDVR